MTYSLSKLTTKAACDTVSATVQKEKAQLEFEQTALERQQDGFEEEGGDSIETQLAAITSDVAHVTGVIATLSEGKLKDSYEKRKASLVLRQMILQEKKESRGVAALLQTEFELAQKALLITEANTLLAALEARKAALPA